MEQKLTKLDLTRLKIYSTLEYAVNKTEVIEVDKQQVTAYSLEDKSRYIADVIYKFGSGIGHHALALKIYNSKDAVDFDMEEIEELKKFYQVIPVQIMMAIEAQIEEQKEAAE